MRIYKHSERFTIEFHTINNYHNSYDYKIYYLVNNEVITTDTVKRCIKSQCGYTEMKTEVRKQLNTSIKLLLEENLIDIYDIDKLQLANLIIDCLI